jgi:hypothetical protein
LTSDDFTLQEILDKTGLDQFELIGEKACLMGHLEAFDALDVPVKTEPARLVVSRHTLLSKVNSVVWQ